MWDMSTGFNKANAATQAALNIEHKEYTKGLKYLCKQVGDVLLKLAYLKRGDEGTWTSILTTWDNDESEMVNLYEIPSLGNFAELGQGKPTNQAFMCQFFDGSYSQAIDCNMDSTLSQSLFVPNVLQEFDRDPTVKIIGHPEYIFTSGWSKAAYAAAFTERVFGTMVQRMWSLLNCRLHYGHPDYFSGIFIMFTTGMSKLSYISEDVFTGFDTLLNGGRSIHVEYIECGKARDVCMISTTKFNRKISGGASQLACARYPYWVLTSKYVVS
jgi:hypothetical protein